MDHSNELREKFSRLVEQYKRETLFTTNPSVREANSAYQEIIKMGSVVLPWIFEDLRDNEGDWFTALRLITGVDPVLSDHLGYYELMRDDWLDWAIKHGFISTRRKYRCPRFALILR